MAEFRISYAGLGPTEVRVLAIAANTAIFFAGNPSNQDIWNFQHSFRLGWSLQS